MTEAIARAIAAWSCYHKDECPRDERHQWCWDLAAAIDAALPDKQVGWLDIFGTFHDMDSHPEYHVTPVYIKGE